MRANQNKSLPSRILFKIDASRCDLFAGDSVSPETPIGEDLETSKVVKAGRHGRVEGVCFDEDDDSLIIVIQPLDH